jgi:hypothetical protein
MKLRYWWLFAITVGLVGCQDATAPVAEQNVLGDVVSAPTPAEGMHILRQSPTAPLLETYQVSFWARRDRASTVIVNYLPAAGEAVGHPFLRFDLPKDALRRGGRGHDDDHGHGRDSLLITLTIDPVNLAVDCDPSGTVFSRRHPATLSIWTGNADPDLNGDGVVDGADAELAQDLALWVRQARPAPWLKLMSTTEAGQWVSTALYHFSEYAVSW